MRDGGQGDLDYIRKSAREWRLDDERLEADQFLVAEESGSGIAGFGRIKPYEGCYELGTVGVRPEWRKKGLGAMIVHRLIERFPSDEVWITTDLVSYFERLGFQVAATGPEELLKKVSSICLATGRRGCKIMLLNRAAETGTSLASPGGGL